MFQNDTISAIATPPGEGGVALIRVSGPDALQIAARVFRPARDKDVATAPGYSVHYGRYVDAEDTVVDDGLLIVFRAPRSYTGEDMVELSCHGGRISSLSVLRLAQQAGSRMAEPGEFTLRAFLNGRLDLAQAEAVADIIRARTESSRKLARRQLNGDLGRKLDQIKDDLIGAIAAIEVTIDFSDEIGELDHDALRVRIESGRDQIASLLANADQGRILREGARVVIVGRPNVGKSSLLNLLLRADRAIVTEIAGTTRDLIEESARIDDLPLVLIDTAGIRETSDLAERIGVQRAASAAADADLLLLALDGSQNVAEDVALLHDSLLQSQSASILYVVNKSDLLSVADRRRIRHDIETTAAGDSVVVFVSALTGDGLRDMENAILKKCGLGQDEESVLISGDRHRQALNQALSCLEQALQSTALSMPGDFIAIDLRGALHALGQISGETVEETIIQRIFHDFCVGK